MSFECVLPYNLGSMEDNKPTIYRGSLIRTTGRLSHVKTVLHVVVPHLLYRCKLRGHQGSSTLKIVMHD